MIKRLLILIVLPLLFLTPIESREYPFLFETSGGSPFDVFKKVLSVERVDPEKPVGSDLVVTTDEISPGQPFWIALRMNIAKGWKAYWKNPGDSGFPLSVDFTLPEGFTMGELQWPAPKRAVVNDAVVFGYENQVLLMAEVTPSKELKAGTNVEIAADVRWLVCSDTTCLPGDNYIVLPLKVVDSAPTNVDEEKSRAFEKALSLMPKKQEGIDLNGFSDDIIELHVPKEAGEEWTKGKFFPEMGQGFDIKQEIVVKKDPKGGLIVMIPRKVGEKLPSTLKGVLLLTDANGSKESSFQIDFGITPEGKQILEKPVQFKDEEHSYGKILFFAFLGGMILNLMPCVLPVISIKVLGFVQMANQSRKETFMHGLLFSLGVLISFWFLAGLMLLLQHYGRAVGWGFQLQDATFVAILTAILLIAALVLFGVMELGTSLASTAGGALENVRKKESGKTSSFFSGVLATALATPCSGPFLGMVLGIAVTLPWYQSLMIFTSLGLGMAFPYLILSANPKWLRFLPKPGAWMDTFKKLMGFLMLLTVIWLLWVFMAQSEPNDMLQLLLALFVISFGAWVFGHWGAPYKKKAIRLTGTIIGSLLMLYGFYEAFRAGRDTTISEASAKNMCAVEAGWENFTKAKLNQLRREGKPVFLDFTAKWCLLCQSNLVSINSAPVQKRMEEVGIVKMMADWTRSDQEITDELARFGRNSVPLYVYYPPGADSEPVVLPQVLTPDIILEYLK